MTYKQDEQADEISYTLTEKQIICALGMSGDYRISPRRIWVQTVCLAALWLFFLASFVASGEWFNLGMSAVCVLAAGFLHIIPYLDRRRRAAEMPKMRRIRLYPNLLIDESGEEATAIPLKDADIRISKKHGVVSVRTADGAWTAVSLGERQERILAVLSLDKT